MFNNLRTNLILIIFFSFLSVFLTLLFFFNIVYYVVMLKESPFIYEIINLIFNNKKFIIENSPQNNFQSMLIICNTVPDASDKDLVKVSKTFSNISSVSLNTVEPNFEINSNNLNETNSNFKSFCEYLKQQYSQNSSTIQQILKLLSIYLMFCGDGGSFTYIVNFCLQITTPITTTPILPVLIDSSTQTDIVVFEQNNILVEHLPLVEKESVGDSSLITASTQTASVNFVKLSDNQNLIINSFITMLTSLTIHAINSNINENVELENLTLVKELPSIFGMFNDSNIISRLHDLFQYKKNLISNMQKTSQIENNYMVESKIWEEKLKSISFIFCEQITNLVFHFNFEKSITTYNTALVTFVKPLVDDFVDEFIKLYGSNQRTSRNQILLSMKTKYVLIANISKCYKQFLDTVFKNDQIFLEFRKRLEQKIFLELHTLYVSEQPFHIILENLNIVIQNIIKNEFDFLLKQNRQELDIIINTVFTNYLTNSEDSHPVVNAFLQNIKLKLVSLVSNHIQSFQTKTLEDNLSIVIQKKTLANNFSRIFDENKQN